MTSVTQVNLKSRTKKMYVERCSAFTRTKITVKMWFSWRFNGRRVEFIVFFGIFLFVYDY